MEMIRFESSFHALKRCSQRNLAEEDLMAIVRYGRVYHRPGVEVFFLGIRDIPEKLMLQLARLAGSVAVFAEGHLVTVWRNRKSSRKLSRRIKRKPRRPRKARETPKPLGELRKRRGTFAI